MATLEWRRMLAAAVDAHHRRRLAEFDLLCAALEASEMAKTPKSPVRKAKPHTKPQHAAWLEGRSIGYEAGRESRLSDFGDGYDAGVHDAGGTFRRKSLWSRLRCAIRGSL